MNSYSQYDGAMATLVLLSHLSACAKLYLVCQQPLPKLKRGANYTPQQQSQVAIKNTLEMHFNSLATQYMSALKGECGVHVFGSMYAAISATFTHSLAFACALRLAVVQTLLW